MQKVIINCMMLITELHHLDHQIAKSSKSDHKICNSVIKMMQFADQDGANSQANREFALLSHICSYAIRWGIIVVNPCSDVRKFSEKRRSRNVTNEEYFSLLSFAQYPINYAMKLIYIMGLRPREVLRLNMKNICDEGFLVELTKTKHSVSKKLVQWSPELKLLIDELVKLNKNKSKTNSLLCNRYGQEYTPDGFATLWQRFMKAALQKNIISESFQFRDLRHKAATDTEKRFGREAARSLLGHTSQNTTARYIDGTSIVQPVTSQ